MADKPDGKRHPPAAKGAARRKRRRRDFANAIAQAEFGRFYWGEEQEIALDEARLQKPRKKPDR